MLLRIEYKRKLTPRAISMINDDGACSCCKVPTVVYLDMVA